MINLVIAYDDVDAKLGNYFLASHDDILASIPLHEIANSSLSGVNCNEVILQSTLEALQGNRFIFVALAHGNEEEVVATEVFVSSNNTAIFSNSLFYSCSCLTGHTLGVNLISAGCLTFIGYRNSVEVIEGYYPIFYACQMYGLKSFLLNPETIQVSYDKMVNNYNDNIDALIGGSMDDLIVASSLINNRDCMVIIGNLGMTKSDFLPN